MNLLQQLKQKTRELRREVFVMYLAMRHPRTPWYAKALAAMVILYAASPIDLIPDPVPVLGYLDDIIIVPAGVIIVRWMIPQAVLDECRAQADASPPLGKIWKVAGAILILAVWLAVLLGVIVGVCYYTSKAATSP